MKAVKIAVANNIEMMKALIPTYLTDLYNQEELTVEKRAYLIIANRRPFDIIFRHEFAQAFFPEYDDHGFYKNEAWKYHLQQMVLEKEPLKYIEKFLYIPKKASKSHNNNSVQ